MTDLQYKKVQRQCTPYTSGYVPAFANNPIVRPLPRTNRCPISRTRNEFAPSAYSRYGAASGSPLTPVPAMPRLIRSAAMVVALALVTACQPGSSGTTTVGQRQQIADTLTAMIRAAYDLKVDDPVARFMSLYPDSGRVVSASGGRITTTHDSLEAGIKSFVQYVGRNMQDPKWMWGKPQVDVLGPDAAVVTMTYRVPHRTPAGAPHVIAGAWTAVFAKRADRWVIIQEHLSEIPAEALAADTADVPAAGHAHHQ